jgi:hypothetical protein
MVGLNELIPRPLLLREKGGVKLVALESGTMVRLNELIPRALL